MQRFKIASRVGATTMAATALLGSLIAAQAADMPAIKVSESNAVPACATPGRLQAYLAKRNPSLDDSFKTIASDYMREGEVLAIRWDMAFFQMMLETGQLSFANGARAAGVKAQQNNFAGLKPIDKPSFESFPDVATGVRAHLQHVVLYTGGAVATPVAERTRRVQEMNMLSEWSKSVGHDVTFDDLAVKWTGGSRSYGPRLEEIAKVFTADFCNKADPHPEMLAAIRGVGVSPQKQQALAALPETDKKKGVDLARKANAEGADARSALGAGGAAAAAPQVRKLNAPTTEAAAPEAPAASDQPVPSAKLPVPQLPRPKASAQAPQATKTAALGAAAKPIVPSPAAQARPGEPPAATQSEQQEASVGNEQAAGAATQQCRVLTASYGGQRSVVVEAKDGPIANYTVLDVNEAQEDVEIKAYIAAYAKGGQVKARFASQDKALDKAFELCPEG